MVLLSLGAAPDGLGQTPASDDLAAATDVLRPGDVVRLKIWREPDLSGDFAVDENGIVVFPKIGPYTVTEHSPQALKRLLVEDYREYLRNVSIDVVVLRRINVLGAVGSPGIYTVDPTMTLADAIALAGGSTPSGDPDEIELHRDGVKVATYSQRTRIGDVSIRSGDHIYIPERNWLLRHWGIVATGISTGLTLLLAFSR